MRSTMIPAEAVTDNRPTTEGKLTLHRERVRRLGNNVRSGIKAGGTCSSHSVEVFHS